MTRRELEITDLKEIREIMDKASYLHLGLVDDGMPYVLPMNYGVFEENGVYRLYLHGATTGRKLDVIQKNPNCCFTMECEIKPFAGEVACQYGVSYKCLMGKGKIHIVDDVEEKKQALSLLMKTQTGKDFTFQDKMVSIVSVMRIDVEEISAKARPLPAVHREE